MEDNSVTNMNTTDNIKNIPPPSLVESSNDDNICMVCYDPLDEETGCVTTKCGHKYCPQCFDKHMKIDNHCAMCRTKINDEKPFDLARVE
jgi:hypothetical protein